jgi:hypothetical protein
MQHDLAELYYKLRQYDHAHRVLDALIDKYRCVAQLSNIF